MATKEELQNFKELLGWIEEGWYDKFLPEIKKALEERTTGGALQVGDTVVFTNCKRDLDGIEAKVIKVNAKSVGVQITKLTALAKKNHRASVGGRWNLHPSFVKLK